MARHVDYECELCAVIGRAARHVPAADALEFVFGYTLCWDISIRDPWGRRPNTRNIRKGFDTFCGVGPWFVTRDEISEPQDLQITVTQNGRQVMQAHTADMINGIRDLIRFLSSVSTLKPGTLITTRGPRLGCHSWPMATACREPSATSARWSCTSRRRRMDKRLPVLKSQTLAWSLRAAAPASLHDHPDKTFLRRPLQWNVPSPRRWRPGYRQEHHCVPAAGAR